MKRFERALTKVLEGIMAGLLFAILATVVMLVTLRYLFNSSITGANELIVILFVYITSMGAAVAVGKGEHLAIVFALDWLPPGARRLANRLSILLVGVINAVAILYSVRWISVTGGFMMPSTGLPRWVAQLSIPLGCSLALVYCALRLASERPAPGDAPKDASLADQQPTP
jgi:TRAP-type C4-dicarboxylate transport system permease small subunit